MPFVSSLAPVQDIVLQRGSPFLYEGTVVFGDGSGSIEGYTINLIVYPDLQNWWDGTPTTNAESLLTLDEASGITITGALTYTISMTGTEFSDTIAFPFGDVRPYAIYATPGAGGNPYELQNGFIYVEEA